MVARLVRAGEAAGRLAELLPQGAVLLLHLTHAQL